MATDAKELERVRFIHGQLDLLVKSKPDDGVTCFIKVATGDGFVTHEYTAAEVRAWPEMKTALLARIARASIGDGAAWCRGIANLFTTSILGAGDRSCYDSVARGLCIYREQLSDALSPGRCLTADGSVRVNEERAEALGIDANATCSCGKRFHRHDGIGGNCCNACCQEPTNPAKKPKVDPYYAGVSDEYVSKLTHALPANVAARVRNIAALAAELSKPAPPRFIAEGRQDRALSVTNGMIRGRE